MTIRIARKLISRTCVRSRSWLLAPTALAIVLGAGPVFAASGTGHPDGEHRPRFPVDLKELDARAAERFNRADANGDGSVSLDEFLDALPPGGPSAEEPPFGEPPMAHCAEPPLAHGPNRRMRHLEAAATPERESAVFAALDKNGDGQIARDEFSLRALHEELRKDRQQAMFRYLDRNSDGMLEKDEMPAPAEHLRVMDTNQDGTVTRAEARAYRRAERP